MGVTLSRLMEQKELERNQQGRCKVIFGTRLISSCSNRVALVPTTTHTRIVTFFRPQSLSDSLSLQPYNPTVSLGNTERLTSTL